MVKNILIVDDDKEEIDFFLEAAQKINGEANYQSVYNGVEALDFLLDERNGLPDLIFSDINMPQMNGRELLQQVRKYDRLKSIDIVMLTTSNIDEDKKEILQLGACNFITKPISLQQLVQLLIPLLR